MTLANMEMTPSVVMGRLRENKPVLLFVPTPVDYTWFIEMAGINGYHGIWIDYEHQNYSDDQMANMCLACRAGGIDGVLRVRRRDAGSYFRALEIGAHGVIVPHVNTAAEARDIVCELKFPPLGNRSMDAVEPAAKFAYVPAPDYAKQANEQTFIVIQIEEPDGVENVDEIAAVPGIDVLMIGPQDLALRYGVLGKSGAPEIARAHDKVAAAANRHGKHWGLPVASAQQCREFVDKGARFFAHGSVFGFVYAGFKKVREDFGTLFGMDQQAVANLSRGY